MRSSKRILQKDRRVVGSSSQLRQAAFRFRGSDTKSLNQAFDGTIVATLEQLAFRFRGMDTSALNAEFDSGSPPPATATLQQLAFRFRGMDTSALNAAFDNSDPPPSGNVETLKHIHLGPSWDWAFSNNNYQTQFEQNIDALTGYWGTSGWDFHKTWALESYSYLNAFGDPNHTWTYQLDSDGAQLWLPWGTPFVDARPSRDMRTSSYRDSWVAFARGIMANGGEGIFVDDANMNWQSMFKRWNGSSFSDPITNFDSGSYYTSAITGQTGWAALFADFMHDVRNRVRTGTSSTGADEATPYPNAKFMLNTQWWWLAPARWTDPRAIRMVQGSDIILVAEHGYADPGHQGGGPGSDAGTDFYLRSLLKYVDMIHSHGKNVLTFARNDGVRADREKYEMALYLLKRTAGDMIGLWKTSDVFPNYNPVFNIDLGERLTYNDNGTTISGTFEGGTASVIPGNYASATITPN